MSYEIRFDGFFSASLINKKIGAAEYAEFQELISMGSLMTEEQGKRVSTLYQTPPFYKNEFGMAVFVAFDRQMAQLVIQSLAPYAQASEIPLLVYRIDVDKIYVPASPMEYISLYHNEDGTYYLHHANNNFEYGNIYQALERLVSYCGLSGTITVSQNYDHLTLIQTELKEMLPVIDEKAPEEIASYNKSQVNFLSSLIDEKLAVNAVPMKREYVFVFGTLTKINESELLDD